MVNRPTSSIAGKGGRGAEEILHRARLEEAVEQERSSSGRRGAFGGKKISDLENPVLRVKKKRSRREVSTFNIILFLLGLATGIVLYISNIIAVDHLAIEVDLLRERHRELIDRQDRLRATVNQQSSRERIVRIASEQIGLESPRGQTEWIVPDNDLLERARAAEGK